MNVPVADALTMDRLFQSIPGNVLVVKANVPDFTVINANNNLAILLHIDQGQLVGQGIFNLIASGTLKLPEDVLKPLTESLRYVAETKQARETETETSGIRFHFAPVTNSQGFVEFITVSIEIPDLTHENDTNYARLFHAPFGMALLAGSALNMRFINNAMKRIWNLSPGQYIGRNLPDVLPRFGLQGYADALKSIQARGEQFIAQEQLVEYEDEGKTLQRFFDFIYQPLPAESALPDDLLIYARDVTDYVLLRKATEESEKRLQIAIDACGIGVWEMNLLDDNNYHSLAHDRIFGYEKGAGEWSIHHFFGHIHNEDKQRVDAKIKEALESGVLSMECKLVKANGEEAMVSVFGKVFYNEDREPVKMIGTITDITEQKEMEEVLNNTKEELERMVEERTSDLLHANTNLQNSNKKLEEFVYAASHDLQEPLRKLITYTGMLSSQEKKTLSEAGKQTVSRITKAVERMQMLVKDLSDLSETSRSQKEFMEVDLDGVLKEVINEQLQEYSSRVVEIRADKLPVIKGVPIQMKQLLENLISNALKFSAHSTPQIITISSAVVITEGTPQQGLQANTSYLELVVSDNGIGFDQEYEDKIFQLFQRLHNKSEYPGTGMGLSICRNIAENHNGLIKAKGGKGKGASFHVFLRLE